MDGIKVFYDGLDLARYGKLPFVVGFTTNTSFMKKAGVKHYQKFVSELDPNDARPLSLQVWDEENTLEQAISVSKLGKNIWVKIPVVKSNGESNLGVIRTLLGQGTKVNITAVFSEQQCVDIRNAVHDVETPVIVSIFAGRISDTARDPCPIVQQAVSIFSEFPHVEILWAGCKEVLSIRKARDIGCHIITVPGDILDKMYRIDMDLDLFSQETARMFKEDAAGIIV